MREIFLIKMTRRDDEIILFFEEEKKKEQKKNNFFVVGKKRHKKKRKHYICIEHIISIIRYLLEPYARTTTKTMTTTSHA